MNQSVENSIDVWETCAPGELQRLVRGARLHHRSRTIRRTILTGGATTIVAVAVWLAVSHFWLAPETCERGHFIAGVFCEDVRRELPDLMAMRVEAQRSAQLQAHIDQCSDCRRFRQQLVEANMALSFNSINLLPNEAIDL